MADFQRFYGIDISNVDTVESTRFFRLMYCLPIYGGAVTAWAEAEKEKAEESVKRGLSPAQRDKSVKYVDPESFDQSSMRL